MSEEKRVPEAARQREQSAGPRGRSATTLRTVADDIPITPRVIDRVAFDEYVRLLQAEINRATSESELLARRAEAGAIILDQLERFMDGNGSVIEHAAEVLAGIDQRMVASREVLDLVEKRAAGLSKASQDAEQAIDARAEAFQNRLRAIVDTAMDRFEETEDQLTARAASARRELLDRLEQMRSRGEDMLGRLDARSADLTTDSEQILARTEARLDALRVQTRELLGSIDSRIDVAHTNVDEGLSRIVTSADKAIGTLEETHTEITKTIDVGRSTAESIRNGCDEATRDVQQHINTLLDDFAAQAVSIVDGGRTQIDDAETASRRRIEQATAQAESARQQLATTHEAVTRVQNSPELRETLERCVAAETATAAAAEQAAEAESQASSTRTMLAKAIREGKSQIDALSAKADTLSEAGVAEAERLEALLAEASAVCESDLIDRIVLRVEERTRAKMRDEMKTAAAALSALSERVAVLEQSRPSDKTVAEKASPKKPTRRASASKKTPSKKAASRTSTPKKATPKAATSKTTETKPTPPAPSKATTEVKPAADKEPSPNTSQ